jgi:hypothetical protein
MPVDCKKVILTDCDGVVLDWVCAFDEWMEGKGYEIVAKDEYKMNLKYGIEKAESKKLVKQFNECAWIGKLAPLNDAIKYVKKLHEECGYVFHAITSLSNDQYAQDLRTQNLKALFGETAFVKFVYLDTGADKDEALAEYKDSGCVWVEDKPENADLGIELGLDSYLMMNNFNKDYDGVANQVNCWKEIYNQVA